MKRKKITGLLSVMAFLMTLLFTPVETKAQADPLFTQYWALPTLLNPAATGNTDFLRIRGGARLQWIGIENAPKSFLATADMPFKLMNKRIGAGVIMWQESLGLFSNLLLSAQGSYKLKAFKGTLGIGVQLGYYNTRFRGSDVFIPDNDDYHQGNDPGIPTQDLSGNAFDISLGLNYTHKYFNVGISGLHLTNPKINMNIEGSESNEMQQYETELPRAIYFDANSNIELSNTLFTLQPSLLIGTDLSDFSADITMRATYNKFITFGLGYRWNEAICVMIGAEFKNFFLGYAFDYPTSSIAKASAGSHELVAGYQLKIDMSGKNKNKHRSIRIM